MKRAHARWNGIETHRVDFVILVSGIDSPDVGNDVVVEGCP